MYIYGSQKHNYMVVFLTAISIHIGLLSSKIHNGDDTPKDIPNNLGNNSTCSGHV
jgi:hypothetical protein